MSAIAPKKLACGALVLLALSSAVFAADQPRSPQVQNLLNTARHLRDQKKWDDAIKTCEQIIAMQAAPVSQKIEAFETEIDVYRRQKNLDTALATAVRIEKELPKSAETLTRSSILQGDLGVEMNKKDQALAAYAAAIERTNDSRVKQSCDYRMGTIHLSEGHTDEALAAFERVFTDSTGAMDFWPEAQHGIVDTFRKANRFVDALQAARISLNAATDANGIASNTQLIAGLLKDQDKNVTRANVFLAFQQYGPAGKDGIVGTADDLQNPLDAIGYATYPQREKFFAQLRASAGDDAAASRLRAWTYVYSGHPADALAHFAEYFRRSHGEPYPMLGVINELIIVGARGVRGHAVGLEKFYDFIRCGPLGPDGKPNTPDDLKDPFAEIGLAPRTPTDDGGLVPPADAAHKALVQMRGFLETLAVAEREDSQFRQSVILDLDRVHTALCDWGTPGQADWYLKLLVDAASNEYEFSTVLHSAQAASRGSDLHYGHVREMWQRIDAAQPPYNLLNAEQVKNVRNSFNGLIDLLEKPQSVAPALAPLK